MPSSLLLLLSGGPNSVHARRSVSLPLTLSHCQTWLRTAVALDGVVELLLRPLLLFCTEEPFVWDELQWGEKATRCCKIHVVFTGMAASFLSSGYKSHSERKEVINSQLDSLTENSREPDGSGYFTRLDTCRLYTFTLIYWNTNKTVQTSRPFQPLQCGTAVGR